MRRANSSMVCSSGFPCKQNRPSHYCQQETDKRTDLQVSCLLLFKSFSILIDFEFCRHSQEWWTHQIDWTTNVTVHQQNQAIHQITGKEREIERTFWIPTCSLIYVRDTSKAKWDTKASAQYCLISFWILQSFINLQSHFSIASNKTVYTKVWKAFHYCLMYTTHGALT